MGGRTDVVVSVDRPSLKLRRSRTKQSLLLCGAYSHRVKVLLVVK